MKKLICILTCMTLSLITFASCGNNVTASDEIYIPIRQGNSVNYDTAHVYKGTILEQVTLDGTFTNPYSQNLSFTMTGGTIESFNVHIEQEVKKGDVIATLSDSDLEEEITVQKLKLDSAKSAYDILSKTAPDSDETAFAKIDYEIEQAEFDSLVARREWLVIYAPFDGKITYAGNYYSGASVKQNATVCTIVDTSRSCLTAIDNHSRLSNVSFGTAVTVSQGAIANTTGRVVDVRTEQAGRGDDVYTRHSYIIQIDDEDVEFEDFGTIQVTFTTLRRDDAIIAPTSAVYETDDGYYVNVLIDNVKVQTYVTVGIVSGDKTEILTGLDGTETLIL